MRKATKLIMPVRLTMWYVTTVMILLLGVLPQASAQFKVGDNPTDIHPAAALQVESANQGVLLPRISDTAVVPLSISPDGMIIYFTDAGNAGAGAGLYVRKQGAWKRMEVAGNSWLLSGNAGTDSSDFIGTTDPQPLRFRVNNIPAGIVTVSGSFADANNTGLGIYALHNTISAYNVGIGSGALMGNSIGAFNTALGARAMIANTEGGNNTAIGYSALETNTTGAYNTGIGHSSLVHNATGSYNTAVGANAGPATPGLEYATAIGADAKVSRSHSIVLGDTAQNSLNVGIGRGTPEAKLHIRATTGNNPLMMEGLPSGVADDSVVTINAATGVVGKRTVNSLVSGSSWSLNGNSGTNVSNFIGTTDNMPLQFRVVNQPSGKISVHSTAIGYRAMEQNVENDILEEGINNVAIGVQAMMSNQTGSYNIGIGDMATVGNPATDGVLMNAVAIGSKTIVRRSNSMVLGDTTLNEFNVGIGRSKPQAKLHIKATTGNKPLILEGVPSGAATDSLLTINAATGEVNKRTIQNVVGTMAWGLTGNSGTDTTTNFIGTTDNMPVRFKVKNEKAGVISERNTAIGYQALQANQRDGLNTAVGIEAMKNNTGGAWNEAVGYQAMLNNTSGNYNVALGALSLMTNVSSEDNVALGHQAAIATTGAGNTAVGRSALAGNSTGENNTAVGRNANVASGALRYATAIGAEATVGKSNAVVLGRTANDTTRVGIGTEVPDAKLHIRGVAWNPPLLMEGVPSGAADDSVLTINAATGVVGKRPVSNMVSGMAWSLNGNSGTTPSQFIGTTDTASLRFRINNFPAGILSTVNTSLGLGALMSTTTGWGNAAFGAGALSENVTGNSNTAMGVNALLQNKANYNTAIGHDAMKYNASGIYNIGIGSEAVRGVTTPGGITGNFNVGIGGTALLSLNTGSNNTAIGHAAMRTNSTGSGNVAIGNSTLYNNSVGVGNLAFGDSALYSNTSSQYNVAIGSKSMFANSTGNENVALGNNTLFSNTNGAGNVAIGTNAMRGNTTGNDNLAIGNQSNWLNQAGAANVSIGSYSLNNNNGGGNNTAIGFRALNANTIGIGNTALGHYADVSTGALTNATAIGYGAIVDASNKVRIGNAAVTVIEGQVAWSFPSDARFKTGIADNVPGLALIKKLKPVTYHFDGRKLDEHSSGKPVPDNLSYQEAYEKTRTGFLAQDVEAVCKELGFEFDAVNKPENERGHYSLAYSQFVMPLVKAVQEQQEMIEQQKADNIALKQQLETQQKALESLLKRLEQLEGR